MASAAAVASSSREALAISSPVKSATTVWKWDDVDPFGDNAPNEDPDGDSNKFTFNLRFPGQYYDRETKEANLVALNDSKQFEFIECDLRTVDVESLLLAGYVKRFGLSSRQ